MNRDKDDEELIHLDGKKWFSLSEDDYDGAIIRKDLLPLSAQARLSTKTETYI